MVANGQLQTPKSTVELKFEVGDMKFVSRNVFCNGETNESLDWSFVPTTKQYHIGHATGSLKFPVFLHAVKDSGSQVHQGHGAYQNSRGYHNPL